MIVSLAVKKLNQILDTKIKCTNRHKCNIQTKCINSNICYNNVTNTLSFSNQCWEKNFFGMLSVLVNIDYIK